MHNSWLKMDLCFGLVQQVLTDVLDEAGYTEDSLMILSDFVKVL